MLTQTAAAPVARIVAWLEELAAHYRIKLFQSPHRAERLAHDLQIMQQAGDLKRINLTLLTNEKRPLTEFSFDSDGNGLTATLDNLSLDGKQAWPTFRQQIQGYRLVIKKRTTDRFPAYQSQLQLDWQPTPAPVAPESPVQPEAAAKPDVKLPAWIFQRRVRLEITRTGGAGYSFARMLIPPHVPNVFCHQNAAPAGFEFRLGATITAMLVDTPRGIQAHDIRQG